MTQNLSALSLLDPDPVMILTDFDGLDGFVCAQKVNEETPLRVKAVLHHCNSVQCDSLGMFIRSGNVFCLACLHSL